MLYGQIRVFMVMSRDGLLPKVFSKVHPVHKTPTLCTIITGSIAAIMAGLLPSTGNNKTLQYRYIICLRSCIYWCYST